jgi:hypothetical protein
MVETPGTSSVIRVRTGEGRARANARGVKLGRKPKLTPHQKREALGSGESCRTFKITAELFM